MKSENNDNNNKISWWKQIEKFTMDVSGINFPIKDQRSSGWIIVKNKNLRK